MVAPREGIRAEGTAPDPMRLALAAEVAVYDTRTSGRPSVRSLTLPAFFPTRPFSSRNTALIPNRVDRWPRWAPPTDLQPWQRDRWAEPTLPKASHPGDPVGDRAAAVAGLGRAPGRPVAPGPGDGPGIGGGVSSGGRALRRPRPPPESGTNPHVRHRRRGLDRIESRPLRRRARRHDRRDRPPGPRRLRHLSRRPRRARLPPALDRRPRRGAPAALERGRLGLDGIQRRDLQFPRPSAAALEAKGHTPPVVGRHGSARSSVRR